MDTKIKSLEHLLKALGSSGKFKIRVGILGNDATAARSKEDNASSSGSEPVTNAEVGAAHEYGTSTLPERSFLRVPLTRNFNKNLRKSGAFDDDVIKDVLKEGSPLRWLEIAKTVAKDTVLEAFATGGGGEWPQSDFSKKHNEQTLVESQQLRDSITAVVLKDG